MKALSMQMPWAWFVIHGHKQIENRTWGTGVRGRIYVHCGAKWDKQGDIFIRQNNMATLEQLDAIEEIKKRWGKDSPPGLYGEVDILDTVIFSWDPWFFGPYGFVLANAQAYNHPIPCKGRLSFFEPTFPPGLDEESARFHAAHICYFGGPDYLCLVCGRSAFREAP